MGAELELFSINEAAGPGLVFWHPKGAMVRHIIEDYWRTTHLARGYQLLFTCAPCTLHVGTGACSKQLLIARLGCRFFGTACESRDSLKLLSLRS